jgi:hypothetical protein
MTKAGKKLQDVIRLVETVKERASGCLQTAVLKDLEAGLAPLAEFKIRTLCVVRESATCFETSAPTCRR